MLALLVTLALQAPLAEAPPADAPPAAESSSAADPLRGDWSKPSGKRVTLASSLTVNAALERIADAAGWSLVLDAGAGGEKPLTLRLRNVPAEDAFRAVLSQAGLVAERRGELVTVRSEGILPGILPPDLSREAQRATEGALDAAQRAVQKAARDAEARDDDEAGDGGGADRHQADSDVVIAAGEEVRDAVAWHGKVRLGPGARARNVVAFGGAVELGPNASAHDAVSFGGKTSLGPSARVRHDAVALGGDLEIGPGAEVAHDAVSIGGKVLVDPSARVRGSVQSIPLPGVPDLPRVFRGSLAPRIPGPIALLVRSLLTFAFLFVVGLGALVLFPRRLEAISAAIAGGPLRSLFAGLFGTVGMVLLAVVLVLTVIGLLLIPFWILAMVAGGVMGILAFACWAGRLLPLPRSRRTQVLELATGALLYAVLVNVPVLGGLVSFATWCLGFGAVLRTRFGAPVALPTSVAPAHSGG